MPWRPHALVLVGATRKSDPPNRVTPPSNHRIQRTRYGYTGNAPLPSPFPDELRKIDAYWRACNYLSVGMIYLRANPLLREPLKAEHIKQRLLGHWGSDPGQSFTWVHLNRLIMKDDLNVMYVSGPGHGAPATLSNSYLEGYYSEVYPDRSADETGMLRLFRAFSSPGGIGSHCTLKRRGQYTKAASWVTAFRTASERHSITPT